jgi:hypothetical protein
LQPCNRSQKQALERGSSRAIGVKSGDGFYC